MGAPPQMVAKVIERAAGGITSALEALAGAFDEVGAPAMIIGGIAVIVRGIPRHTQDIDGTMWGQGIDLLNVLYVLRQHGIVPRIADAEAFARANQVLLLEHDDSRTPIDLTLAWLPFEWEALERATIEKLDTVSIKVAVAEDLVIYKAVAWRDRDRSDIERLLVRHGRAMDRDRLRDIVRQFAEALDAPERVDEFDILVERALGANTES